MIDSFKEKVAHKILIFQAPSSSSETRNPNTMNNSWGSSLSHNGSRSGQPKRGVSRNGSNSNKFPSAKDATTNKQRTKKDKKSSAGASLFNNGGGGRSNTTNNNTMIPPRSPRGRKVQRGNHIVDEEVDLTDEILTSLFRESSTKHEMGDDVKTELKTDNMDSLSSLLESSFNSGGFSFGDDDDDDDDDESESSTEFLSLEKLSFQ
jgi:hypothetical protein